MQATQQQSGVADVLKAAYPDSSTRRVLLTVSQFHLRNPAFTQAALRNLIFKAESRKSTKGTILGNGLIEIGAIIRLGRKVLFDEDAFFLWVDKQNGVDKQIEDHPASNERGQNCRTNRSELAGRG